MVSVLSIILVDLSLNVRKNNAKHRNMYLITKPPMIIGTGTTYKLFLPCKVFKDGRIFCYYNILYRNILKHMI